MSVKIHESQMMPADTANHHPQYAHPHQNFSLPTRTPSDKSVAGREHGVRQANGTALKVNGNGTPAVHSISNGRPIRATSIDKRASHEETASSQARASEQRRDSSEAPKRDDGYFASIYSSSETTDSGNGTTHVKMGQMDSLDGAREASKDFVPHVGEVPGMSAAQAQPGEAGAMQVSPSAHRVSSPPAFNHNAPSPAQHPYRLQQRHTLEVPKLATARARDAPNNTDDVISASGRFSPTAGGRRRGSMSLVRRTTRSVNSDMHLDEVPQDDDAARWAEHIRQKRASKRKRKEDEDEDRVVVGTKVDQHHVNWVTAYNMLTGIRFTVSRTNAKMDRDLTDADFDAKHKFSFDMYVPPGFPHMVKYLLEFSFLESGWPV
jgi:1-phosphatidylinositol-4-phosphate 5-kinase